MSAAVRPPNVVVEESFPLMRQIADKIRIDALKRAAPKKSTSGPRIQGMGGLAALKSFSIGAVSSAVGAMAVYPIDLVKTRLQAQRNIAGTTPLYKGTWDCLLKVIRNEGVMALYKGLIPQLIGQVPEKAMRLFVVDFVRNLNPSKDGQVNYTMETLAGMTAGTTQVLITNPSEIIKVRMQVGPQDGVPKTSLSIMKDLGFRGLYKGASACFLRDIPFSAIYFGGYAKMKEMMKSPEGDIGPIKLFLAGSAAGIAAAALVTPADVVKTRLQVEAKKGLPTYSGLIDCFMKTYRTEGWKALFKGVVPRVCRSSPQYGVMLVFYEFLQKLVVSSDNSDNDMRWVKYLKVEDKWGLLMESRWAPPPTFTKIAGGFKQLSVGGTNHVWAIGVDNKILRWAGHDWEPVAGNLRHISVGSDGTVCGIQYNDDRAVQWDGKSWVSMSGELKKVSVGNHANIWGTDHQNRVFRWNEEEKLWKLMDGKLQHLSVGSDGTVCGVSTDNKVFKWDDSSNKWQAMPGTLAQVSVGNKNNIWGVDSKDGIFKFDGRKWQQVDENLVQVSVGDDGSVWGVAEKPHTPPTPTTKH